MNEIKRLGLKAFAWDFSGMLVNQGTTFIISVFLARLLDPKDFGLIGMVTVFISMAQSLSYFGFGEAIIQKKESTHEQISTMFYINLLAGVALGSLLFFFAPFIARFYEQPALADMSRVLSLSFILISLNLIQKSQLSRELKLAFITKTNIYSSLISGIVGIVLAFNGFGVWSLVYKTLLGHLLQTIFIWKFSSWRPLLVFNLRSISEHWNYGYKMYLSGIIYTVSNQLDVLVIGKLLGARELGFFYRAKSFNQLIIRYSSESLTRVLLPLFSKIQDNREQISDIAQKSMHSLNYLTFAIMGFFFLTAEDLIYLLFGEKWLPAVYLFQIMIFYAYAYPVTAILGNIIQGLGNSAAFLKIQFIKRFMGVLALIFGFYYGIEGYLWSMVGVSFLGIMLDLYFVSKEIEIKIVAYLGIIFRYAAVSSLATAITYWCIRYLHWHLLHLIAGGFIFFALYLFVNWLSKSKGQLFIFNLTQTFWTGIKNRMKSNKKKTNQ